MTMGQDLLANATDVYEIHEEDHWANGERLAYLSRTIAQVWLREPSERLPKARVIPGVPIGYRECTAAYMLAHVIPQTDVIGIYGITGDDEYEWERANLEFWIGYGMGQGVEFKIHPNSKLMTSRFICGHYGKQDWKAA